MQRSSSRATPVFSLVLFALMLGCILWLTALGAGLYGRLEAKEQIAFAAMKGEEPLSCVAVSVQGKAKEIGPGRLPDLFRKNPYMEKIYAAPRSRSALTVFQIYGRNRRMV